MSEIGETACGLRMRKGCAACPAGVRSEVARGAERAQCGCAADPYLVDTVYPYPVGSTHSYLARGSDPCRGAKRQEGQYSVLGNQ